MSSTWNRPWTPLDEADDTARDRVRALSESRQETGLDLGMYSPRSAETLRDAKNTVGRLRFSGSIGSVQVGGMRLT